MALLHIRLFGCLQATLLDGALCFTSSKERALLAYLVLHRSRPHPRPLLAGLLWGDGLEKCAQHSLRNALWHLRSLLEPPSVGRGTFLRIEPGTVEFNPAGHCWLDVAEFESVLEDRPGPAHPSAEQAIRVLEAGLALYRGHLLEDLYEDWSMRARDRYRSLFVKGTRHLIELYASVGRVDDAIECAQRLLAFDPLLESVHRRLMELFYQQGDRAEAVRQFHHCQQILRREFDLEPMQDTRDVYDMIRRGTLARVAPALSAARHLEPVS